jgi:hypothetical protein
MQSATYSLIRAAIGNERQITCTYQGYYREICPHIIGRKDGDERLLAFQFGGNTSSGLPPGGAWKCFSIAEMNDVKARDGRWHTGTSHSTSQKCVAEIDLDINVHVRPR